MFPYAIDSLSPKRCGPVIFLIAANFVCFVVQLAFPEFNGLAFDPAHPLVGTWITSQFLHGGVEHLLGNMYALWLFGPILAARSGRWFLPFYLTGGAAANFFYLLTDPGVPTVGASGAICALMGAHLALFPRERLKFFKIFGNRVAGMQMMEFTLSAFLFVVFYVLLQVVSGMGGGADNNVAYWAHVGGLFFGIGTGFLINLNPQEPVQAAPDAKEVEALRGALAAGDDESAAALFSRAVERDGGFEMPAAAEQLAAAEVLYRTGRAQLARAALDRLTVRWPQDSAAARAFLTLGDLEQCLFKEFAKAAGFYAKASAHPAADAATRRDAAEGLASARAALDKNCPVPTGPEEVCALLFEAAPPLTENQREAVAALVGADGSDPRSGFLARFLPTGRAASTAAALERAGVPTVVAPESLLARLREPVVIETMSLNERGPGRGEFGWEEVLLIAAVWIQRSEISPVAPEEVGILEVEVQNIRRLEPRLRTYPRLELIVHDGRRVRWEAPDADSSALRGFVSQLEMRAPQARLDWGARGLLEGLLPEFCRFANLSEAEDYLHWQVALARLKSRRGYGV